MTYIPMCFAEEKGKIKVLFKNLSSGKKEFVLFDFKPSMYVRSADVNSLTDLGLNFSLIQEQELKVFNKRDKFSKLQFDSVSSFFEARNKLKKSKIDFFEADFPIVKKFIYDSKIKPLSVLTNKEPPFESEKFAELSNLKVLAFDIETYGEEINFDKNPILMFSLYGVYKGKTFKKVVAWLKDKKSSKTPPYVEIVSSEKELLERFVDLVNKYSPDVLVGYSSDSFDFPYLIRRAGVNSVKLLFSNSKPKFKRSRFPSVHVDSFIHIDLFRFVRNFVASSLKTETYDLNSVASEILHDNKVDVTLSSISQHWRDNDLTLFYEYNLKDSELAFKLFEELFPNMIELVKLTSLPLFDVSRMSYSQIVEWHLISESKKFGMLVPNKPNHDEISERTSRSYEGAFVFQPSPGIYDNIIVFDFKSLYPSIIDAHNISPDSYRCSCCRNKKEAHVPGFDNYWFCLKNRGFIPEVIHSLIVERTKLKRVVKRDKSDRTLLARERVLKKITNSMYGYLGFFGSRWYCFECAESITSYGRYYIQRVIHEAEDAGFKVIYSDTDSIFMSLGTKTRRDAERFVESINNSLPGLMNLDFQGFYPRGLFVSSRGSSSGAKKKYALLTEDKSIKFVGLEFVRRNYCPLAKEVQSKVVEMILNGDNREKILSYIKQIVEDLKHKRIKNDKLIMRTQLQKMPSSYKSYGPHVVLAQKMRKRGFIVHPGMIIEYIVKPGSGRISSRVEVPSECSQGCYDSEYYITHQVLQVVDSLLQLIGSSKRDVLSNNKSLKNFF